MIWEISLSAWPGPGGDGALRDAVAVEERLHASDVTCSDATTPSRRGRELRK
jgi:hypothetical protein